MRLPSFFSRGGGGRGGGARALRAIRRPPMLQQTQASASADHVRRKTERAKRREESGSWKDPEALGHVRSRFPHWIGLFRPGSRLRLRLAHQAVIFAHASQADLQRRIAMKSARYTPPSFAAPSGVDLKPAHLPADFAWRMCSEDEVRWW